MKGLFFAVSRRTVTLKFIQYNQEGTILTREEIRQAFRQAQQEEFSAVPRQPAIHASPKFEQKMMQKLRLAPRPISNGKRAAILLLAAILLVLGGCTVYQAVSASIQYAGKNTYYHLDSEYRYLVTDAVVAEDPEHVPHYQFPDPEGFLHLCSNDVGQDYLYPVACVDQWYNPDTGDVLTLTQERQYTDLEFDPPMKLKSAQLNDVTVYYGCGREEAYAFWLYDQSAIKLAYWGTVSEAQLLSWIGQMDYTGKPAETNWDAASDYYCCIPSDIPNSYRRPEALEFRYYLRPEAYQSIADENTGRNNQLDYQFAAAPEGFTLVQTENEYSPETVYVTPRTHGGSYTYENLNGEKLVLSQTILMSRANSGYWIVPVSGSQLGEAVSVSDLDGIYIQQEDHSRLVWHYGGRMMEILYYGDVSKESLIAIAETVHYSQK